MSDAPSTPQSRDLVDIYQDVEALTSELDEMGDEAVANALRDALEILWFKRLYEADRARMNGRP